MILVGAMSLFVIGSFLMTHIQANTTDVVLWGWMFVMGIGIGPSMSGFTVVVQNSAPAAQLGVATSTLTFLRQVGASIGLAISGTFFSQEFTQKLPGSLIGHGVPGKLANRFAAHGAGSGGSGNLTGVGLSNQLHHTLPANLQGLIPNIIAGINDAFSLAIGNVFWLTVAAGACAFISTLFIAEIPLRDRASASLESVAADTIPGAEVPICEDSAPGAVAQ
jgi:hypothetical protein